MSVIVPGETPDRVRFSVSPRRYGGVDYRKPGESALRVVLKEGAEWLPVWTAADLDDTYQAYKDLTGWSTFGDLHLSLFTDGGVASTCLSNRPWTELEAHLTGDLSADPTLALAVEPAFQWDSATGTWTDVSGVPVCPPSGADAGGTSRDYPAPSVATVTEPAIAYDPATDTVLLHNVSVSGTLMLGGSDVAALFAAVDARLDALEG